MATVPQDGLRVRKLKGQGLGYITDVLHNGACTITWDDGVSQNYAMASQGALYEVLDGKPSLKKQAKKKAPAKKQAKKKAGKKAKKKAPKRK